MAPPRYEDTTDLEAQPLTSTTHPRASLDSPSARASLSSISTTSLILERISDPHNPHSTPYTYEPKTPISELDLDANDDEHSKLNPSFLRPTTIDRKFLRLVYLLAGLCALGWVLALGLFLFQGAHRHLSSRPHDPYATVTKGSGKKISLDSVFDGSWRARSHGIQWIKGAEGEDGLLLERSLSNGADGGWLVVEDVKHRGEGKGKVLMKQAGFQVGSEWVFPADVWPSPDLKKVLVMSERQSNWRHSFTGRYWIFDVESQKGEALDSDDVKGRVQLASWSPKSDAVVFTRNNNMFLRRLGETKVTQITKDGGSELFYGVPDWVYEEEVFSGNSATWWSEDGKYIAFLRTNESEVPEYPIQYFVSRPSGEKPEAGLENYPEVRQIKYPKAGAPNPTVDIRFYEVSSGEIFGVEIEGDFEDHDRLITEVVWAGTTGKVLVRETNRESDVLKVILMDVSRRSGKTVREQDVKALDGGWFEVSEYTKFIPSDPGNGRPHDGYIDTVIHEGYDHLAYFAPLDNAEPTLLTSGKWEVVDAPSAIDLKNNLVYFVATRESSIQRHVYYVPLTGGDIKPLTDVSKEGYYGISFSSGAGYGLLSYSGPGIPWQKVISTPSTPEQYTYTIEENKELARMAQTHELPIMKYQTITIDGVELNLLERRPPHFNEKQKYPVLFYMYQGPGSQMVNKRFNIDFEAYIASNLGYIVVTLDGRGTGFLGRKVRCVTRGNLGYWESHDQIAAAKEWKKKRYVDGEKMAIWGWSYGGFMTLKTLEQDAGETFKYGMAVAPVTDWRFYDSIYTERYMHTPQHNPSGYDNATISNVTALSQNVRWLMMHGVADDNVHMQNSLTLLDKLDLAGIENYDVHVFPDSDHGIYFHGANRIVYDKLSNWLINAFNGEWLRTEHAVPKPFHEAISEKR